MSVLAEIVASSRRRAQQIVLPNKMPEQNAIDFAAALRRRGKLPQLIAELKRRSPSKGMMKAGMPVAEAVRLYAPYAAALSILTEPEHFHGSLEDLHEARWLTQLPLLRKDFIVDERQVIEARLAGANSFLLIVAALDDLELKQLIAAGRKWGMEPLVEVATEKELSRALEAGAQIIGINNRDLHTLEMDMTRAPRLAEKIPTQKREQLVLVAESGYSERDQLLALPHYFDAVLMGTAFMEHGQPEKKLEEIFGPAQRR